MPEVEEVERVTEKHNIEEAAVRLKTDHLSPTKSKT
jgi:hypothetical protein